REDLLNHASQMVGTHRRSKRKTHYNELPQQVVFPGHRAPDRVFLQPSDRIHSSLERNSPADIYARRGRENPQGSGPPNVAVKSTAGVTGARRFRLASASMRSSSALISTTGSATGDQVTLDEGRVAAARRRHQPAERMWDNGLFMIRCSGSRAGEGRGWGSYLGCRVVTGSAEHRHSRQCHLGV